MANLINFNDKKKRKKTVYGDSESVRNLCRYVVGEDESMARMKSLELERMA